MNRENIFKSLAASSQAGLCLGLAPGMHQGAAWMLFVCQAAEVTKDSTANFLTTFAFNRMGQPHHQLWQPVPSGNDLGCGHL